MKQVFDVQGMSCNHCAKAVTQALRQVDPQAQVQVDLAGKKVEVESAQPRQALAQAIVAEGYAVAA